MTIEVQLCPLSVGAEFIGSMRTLLNDDERARELRFNRQEDRQRFVIGRALARIGAATSGRRSSAVRFRYSASGKPFVDGGPAFNVSHSGSWIALALSPVPIGIDIEAHAEMPPYEIMAVAFSETEKALVRSCSPMNRIATFYDIWARKEAVLKADGCGIHDRLAELEVVNEHGDWQSRLSVNGSNFIVRSVHVASAGCALATSAATDLCVIRQLDAGSLREMIERAI